MPFIEVLLLSLALAMDCFAISFSITSCQPNFTLKNQFILASLFGFFQGGMPVIGYYTGTYFHKYIEAFDHWIAGGILLFIGAKMIYESFDKTTDNQCKNYMTFSTILLLSIATSIDALAVGFSFSLLNMNILMPVVTIGIVTTGISILAFFIGKQFSKRFKSQWAMIFGGLVLIGICIKIIVEHTLN